MEFQFNYAVVGGDMRQVYLTQELAQDSKQVCHYALCSSPKENCRSDKDNITEAESLEKLCSAAPFIICPIPFCKNGAYLNQSVFDKPIPVNSLLAHLQPGQSLFAGSIPPDFQAAAEESGVYVYDLMRNQPLAVFNTIATAEGAVCEAISRSPYNLRQSACAVLGYGKCGRTIAGCLKGMFCSVYVAANRAEERAEASIIADKTGTLTEFGANAGTFDFIFNTVPSMVIPAALLAVMKKTVTIIDIASAPGGVDFTAADKLGINAVLCPGLPGRYAPASSAKAVKETIEKILKE